MEGRIDIGQLKYELVLNMKVAEDYNKAVEIIENMIIRNTILCNNCKEVIKEENPYFSKEFGFYVCSDCLMVGKYKTTFENECCKKSSERGELVRTEGFPLYSGMQNCLRIWCQKCWDKQFVKDNKEEIK